MRPCSVTSLLALLCMTGCLLEPGDLVYLSGTAQEADGGGWQGAPLTLLRADPDAGMPYDLSAFDELPFLPYDTLAPDAKGRFLYSVTARELRADGDQEDEAPLWMYQSFELHLPETGDGARDWMRFDLHRDADLPPLRRWESGLQLEPEGAGLRVRFTPMPPVADIPAPAHVVEVRAGKEPAWSVMAPEGSLRLEPVHAEDWPGASVTAWATAAGVRQWYPDHFQFHVLHRAPGRPWPFAPRIPVSRGAACEVNDLELAPCPVTDGRLDIYDAFRPLQGLRQVPEFLTLRFAAPARPARLLVRGLFVDLMKDGALVVEGTVDGSSWEPLGSQVIPTDRLIGSNYFLRGLSDAPPLMEHFLDVAVAPDAPAVRALRLKVMGSDYPDGGPVRQRFFISIREVSVFADEG